MKRIQTSPRRDWQSKVESIGLTYHSIGGKKYWDESVYYQLTAAEVDELEKTANDLHEMYIATAGEVIALGTFEHLGIPQAAVPAILRSWERDDFSLYGRFDFSYDGVNPPKLLEYNADTPTALVEAAVAQWYWLQDTHPQADQFNSIHEKLVAAWKKFRVNSPGTMYLGGMRDSLEDAQTVLYLEDTCRQAGLPTNQLYLEDLGFDSERKRFVDLPGETVENYFKLYPWEWMWHEEFSKYLELDACHFIEPMWKMVLSNKAILPLLWQKFPDHPNLLPAFFTQDEMRAYQSGKSASYVKKPKFSREGANVTVIENGKTIIEKSGDYGAEGFIYQQLAPVANFDENFPIMGVWIINHDACGLGIREDTARVTGNLSRFVPHLFQSSA